MLTALLVDDEPLANERMRSLLAAHGGIEVVATAGSVQAARAVLESQAPSQWLDVHWRALSSGYKPVPPWEWRANEKRR